MKHLLVVGALLANFSISIGIEQAEAQPAPVAKSVAGPVDEPQLPSAVVRCTRMGDTPIQREMRLVPYPEQYWAELGYVITHPDDSNVGTWETGTITQISVVARLNGEHSPLGLYFFGINNIADVNNAERDQRVAFSSALGEPTYFNIPILNRGNYRLHRFGFYGGPATDSDRYSLIQCSIGFVSN